MDFDLQETLRFFAVAALPFLFALSAHEASHALAAYKLGDTTSKDLGRLTLNPIKHVSPLGLTVLLVTRFIGWAKPVPVDMSIVGRKKYGMAIVAAAGPLANIITAIVSAGLLFVLTKVMVYIIYDTNIDPELFGKVFPPLLTMVTLSIRINLVLAFLNLLPIPSLDGGRILADLLPPKHSYYFDALSPYGFLILVILLKARVLSPYLSGATNFFYGILTSPSQDVLRILL